DSNRLEAESMRSRINFPNDNTTQGSYLASSELDQVALMQARSQIHPHQSSQHTNANSFSQ
ncbi:MAG: hypothetical protein MUC48_10525, partial [Leptolyngbya sp. Prado105]|nr:hypothetical protein [Leptolyngbya sp. Prado105]